MDTALDLRDLELLVALADGTTMTAAAEALYVSQPALSQRLGKMEDRLGVRLFDRQGRRLVPNAAGRRMLVSARQILADLRTAVRDVQEIRDGHARRVRLTTQCSTTFQWLPPVLSAFRERQPSADLQIIATAGDEPIPALLEDRVDVALVTKFDQRMDQVELTPLFEDEMVAVVAAGHPWVGRPHLTAEDFDGAHLILYDIYDQASAQAAPLPLPHGARPARITTVPVISDLIIEMVAGGAGATILPNWVASPYLATHSVAVVQVGLPPEKRTWYCATRRGPQPPPIADFARELITQLGRETSS